ATGGAPRGPAGWRGSSRPSPRRSSWASPPPGSPPAPSRLPPAARAPAPGHFGAAFRIYDVAWVVPLSIVAAVYPELARTPSGHPRVGGLVPQAFEALLLVALPIALGLGVGASWVAPWIYGPGYGPA